MTENNLNSDRLVIPQMVYQVNQMTNSFYGNLSDSHVQFYFKNAEPVFFACSFNFITCTIVLYLLGIVDFVA